MIDEDVGWHRVIGYHRENSNNWRGKEYARRITLLVLMSLRGLSLARGSSRFWPHSQPRRLPRHQPPSKVVAVTVYQGNAAGHP